MAPFFQYEARNKAGEKITGKLEADNSTQLAKQLKNQDYYVTSITEKRKEIDIGKSLKLSKKVKLKDIAIFSQQFSAMIDAGMNLVASLSIMEEQIEHSRLKEVIANLQEDVEAGSSLFDSMKKYPDVFPNLFCQMVRTGESAGVLDRVLTQLAIHYEKQAEINGKIKAALYYPATIVAVAIVVVIFLLTSVVPTFTSMFASNGALLPLPTRILLGISGFMQNYWWLILLTLVFIIILFSRLKKTPKGEFLFDQFTLKIPVFGKMMQKVYISRFANTLAILLASGVDLLSSIKIVEDVINNRIYGEALTEARGQVREGAVFSKPLEESEIFPSIVVQMVRVGEEAGSLENMLKKIASFYDREVESSIEGSVSLIEPIIIVLLAVVVGFIVISIVLPMFDMLQQF